MIAAGRRRLRPAWRGSSYYFAFGVLIALYMPFLSLYYAQLGLNGRQIGLLSALTPLLTLLLAPGITSLADRRGWRIPILSLGLATLGAGLLWMGGPRDFAGLLPPVLLLAVASCAVGPIGDSLLARMATRYRLEYGQLRFWCSLSYAAVAVGAGALWQQVGFAPMFLVAAFLCLPLLGAGALLEEEPPGPPSAARQTPRAVLRDPRLRAMLVSTFGAGLALNMVAPFAGVYMGRLGGGQWLVGLLSGIAACSELPMMHWSGAVLRRLGSRRTLVLAYGLLGSAFLGFALAGNPVLLLGAGCVQGLGFGLFLPTTIRLVDAWAPPQWSATTQGLMSAARGGLAALIAGPLAGWIYDTVGPVGVFAAGAAGCAFAAGSLVLLLARPAEAVAPPA